MVKTRCSPFCPSSVIPLQGLRKGLAARSKLVLRVARAEQDGLAFAGGERDRQVGVAGGELRGGHGATAERGGEVERGPREMIDRAERRREFAGLGVDADGAGRDRRKTVQRL